MANLLAALQDKLHAIRCAIHSLNQAEEYNGRFGSKARARRPLRLHASQADYTPIGTHFYTREIHYF
jgi:hypothetical protein